MTSRKFEISFGRLSYFLTGLFGMAPNSSGVFVDDEAVTVRMGWAFRAKIPRSSINTVTSGRSGVYGIGVHGWAGTWVVNGRQDILWIDIDSPSEARALLFPVRLRRLGVSLEDPEGFLEKLGLDARV